MQLHYLFSDKKAVKAAVVTFNGEVQKHCTLANDDKGYIIRRTFTGDAISGSEKLEGTVVIELPAGVRGGPYKTREKESDTVSQTSD